MYIPLILLLAEFSVRTVNYGPSFFPPIYGPSAKRAGHTSMEKTRTDRKNGANKGVFLSVNPKTDFRSKNGFRVLFGKSKSGFLI